jgi:cell wall-associated NlpC family hydrolase
LPDHDSARHRAPQRAVTPFSEVGDAVTGRLAVVGRSSAAFAVSTGLIAAVGIPAQSSLSSAAAQTAAPLDTSATGALATANLLSTVVTPVRAATLFAPTTATVSFEANAFTADPVAKPTAPKHIGRTKTTAPGPRTAVPAKTTALTKASPHQATAPAKHAAAPAKTSHTAKRTTTARSTTKVKSTTKAKTATKTKSAPKAKAVKGVSARGASVLSVASRYVGTPYRYGGTTPRGFDCSGFTQYVYRQLGKSLPRTANQQMLATHHIARSQARAGDLVFFVSGQHAYHVAIYAGNGMIYDSPHTGASVSKRAIWDAAVVYGRVTG